MSLIILDLDQDGDGCVSIHEFLNKMYDCKLANLRRKLCASAYARDASNWMELFRRYDREGSGMVSFEIFKRAVRKDINMSSHIGPAAISDTELGQARHTATTTILGCFRKLPPRLE